MVGRSLRYRDNRVTAVVHAANAECEKAAVNKAKAPAPTATGFHTGGTLLTSKDLGAVLG